MGIIDNDLFTQTNPNPNSPRNNPSLAGQLTNLNNEVNSIEDTLVQGYVRESASVSYVSSSSFTVSGDVTAIYTNGRIVRFSDGTTGIVSSSSYSSTTAKTTVTMLTGTVPSSLSYVDIAIQAKGLTSSLASRVLGDNNVAVVSQKDSAGTARNILNLNSSNDLEIGGSGINKLIFNTPFDGWIATNETWTFSSWDASVYTGVITVPSNATTKYSPGMRIKITQSTGGTKYGIITAVSSTSLTVFFGTDYTLNNEAISNPYYSPHKAPLGFPLNPNKWQIELKPSNAHTSNPTQNTWYNAASISIPIGVWRITIKAFPFNSYRTNTGRVSTNITLSTANNSESDSDFTSKSLGSFAANGSEEYIVSILFAEKTLALSTKTTYYLNYSTVDTGMSAVGIGSIIIRIICAYL